MKQNEQVLEHLQKGLEISPLEALAKYKCFRLAARIYDLRDNGWPIYCDRRDVGEGRKVGFYYLDADKSAWPK